MDSARPDGRAHRPADLIDEITARLDERLRAVRSVLLADTITRDEFHGQVAGILSVVLHDLGLDELGRGRDAALSGDATGRSRALSEIHPRSSLQAASLLFEVALPVLEIAAAGARGTIAETETTDVATTLNRRVFATVEAASIAYVDVMHGRIGKVQLEERRSLARELHDNVAQDLASAIMRLELSAQPGGDPDGHILDDALDLLKGSLLEVQYLAVELRQLVGDRPLTQALGEFIETAGLSELVRMSVAESLAEPVGQHREETFLIVREAVRNAVEHARASRIDISLTGEARGGARYLVATVRDDGVGFELANRRPYGMGLVGMRERAELIGAQLTLDSALGDGSTVTLRVPTSWGPA